MNPVDKKSDDNQSPPNIFSASSVVATPPSHKKKWVIVALTFAVLVIVGVGLYIYLMHNGSANTVNDTTESSDRKVSYKFDYVDVDYTSDNLAEKPNPIKQSYDTDIKTADAKTYLPIWEEVFKKQNAMSDAYFNSHIFPISANTEEIKTDDHIEQRFEVAYYFQVDWARVNLVDNFTYGLDGYGVGITADELLQDMKVSQYKTKYPNMFITIQMIKQINTIISKQKAIDVTKTLSPLLGFDVNAGLRMSSKGDMILHSFGTISAADNKCISGSVDLATASEPQKSEDVCSRN